MTVKELIEELKQFPEDLKVCDAYNEANHDYLINQIGQSCKYCSNNPQNGGSGICHCMLGSWVITND